MKVSFSYRAFQGFNALVMLFVITFTLYPFVYLVAQSFSSEAAIYAGKVTLFPVEFTSNTYKLILQKPEFYKYYSNTILYAVLGTLISVSLTAMLAYPLSKDKLRLNKFFIPFVLFTMYFGGGLIPNYVLVAQMMHMRDTIWAIIIPGAISAFNVILVKTFFAGLPNEVDEAARVDGLGTYGIFARITLPLSKPILATMVLFSMVAIWNDWFSASLYLQSKDHWPVALYLRQIIDSAIGVNEFSSSDSAATQIAATIKSTAMILTSLPIICIYPFVQKYFVQGMLIGSVKG
ncbi:carbohydrate ABC transporter permease [Paenibacillus sp. PR3]|uniref:Carbohydrate ABC transporter permease n=1 Tax=Paenibacillus terricola TaxID=2763503 RepID=A0ABR8N050_9BACL|nr:carbohydrate ABC transporter permease [Paenibacillus terricola]MBD3920722.1 carbohydrate ABC transporter permease [Paenibacillus terricola]